MTSKLSITTSEGKARDVMTTPRPARRYLRDLAIAIVVYCALLALSLFLIGRVSEGIVQWLVMIIPLPALVAVAVAVLRQIRGSDELESRITIEAMAIGFAIGSLATFTYGLLQIAGAPNLSWTLVWPVYAVGWIIGTAVVRLRY